MAVFQEQRLRAVQAWFPKLLFLNSMDPMYRFPQSRWLQDLFESVTLPEAMLLSFERMQVCLFEVLLNCGFVRYTVSWIMHITLHLHYYVVFWFCLLRCSSSHYSYT